MKLLVVLSLTVVAVFSRRVPQQGSTAPITRASNAFANRLYQQVAKKSGNILVCPVSLHVVLALLHQGAGGNTATELANTLGLAGSNDRIKNNYRTLLNRLQDNTLKVATKLYPADGAKLNQTYRSDAEQYFLSGVETLNFLNAEESARKMNTFVENATNNKIRNLIKPDSLLDTTRLVIINAVHFQASWKYKFTTVKDGIFNVNEQQKVTTKMMSQSGMFGIKWDRELGATILKMNYDVEGYSMLIVLPNQVEGLAEVEAKLQNTGLMRLQEDLYTDEVEVTVPKFTIEQTMELNDILKQLGLTQMFTDRADLLNIAEGEHLFVSEVLQKSFIDFHENGTEAAAATGLITMDLSARPTFQIFIADRPFLFLLVSHDELVLFMGRVSAP